MKKSEIDSYLKAGEIAIEVKKFAYDIIKPGMKLIDIAEAIDNKILELGGEFAFPVNLGLNEVAAHFTPTTEDKDIAEGILKIDIGIAIDGFIADTAFSVDLSKDKKFEEMIKLNEEILSTISNKILLNEELKVKDIGNTCQDTMDKHNKNKFAIIKSLSGHSLARGNIHAGLTISNYRNDSDTILNNLAFAIEPFLTTGVGDIFEGKGGGIYVLKSEGQVRDRDARKILEFIRKTYGSSPFCARWLKQISNSEAENNWSATKLRFTLSILVKQGILHEYPILIEKSRKPVSQAENTFLIVNGNALCTTEK